MLGATGLVGGAVVDALAGDPGVAQVRAAARRPVDRWSARAGVETVVVDFQALAASADALACDQVFLCLGTTRRKAGSREAFRAVDHDLTLAAARAALEGGARHAFLVSSVGADPASRFHYLRVKGEVEDGLSALPFESVHIVRPAILAGDRSESRPLERLTLALLGLAAPVMVGPLARQRPVTAGTVAAAMVAAAQAPGRGRHVHESETLGALAESLGARAETEDAPT